MKGGVTDGLILYRTAHRMGAQRVAKKEAAAAAAATAVCLRTKWRQCWRLQALTWRHGYVLDDSGPSDDGANFPLLCLLLAAELTRNADSLKTPS